MSSDVVIVKKKKKDNHENLKNRLLNLFDMSYDALDDSEKAVIDHAWATDDIEVIDTIMKKGIKNISKEVLKEMVYNRERY